MNKALGKLLGLHQAFWSYDPWYRRAWLIGPQALSLTALVLLLVPGVRPPPAAQWAKPLPPSQAPQTSADHQLCMNQSADFRQRGEACDRLIQLGRLPASELAVAYFARGWMRWSLDQIEPAIVDFSETLKLNPSDRWAYNNRGAMYLRKSELPNALRDLNEAIRIEPKFALALANRAEVLRRQGKLAEALADADKAIEIDQKLARALSVRAAVQADVKRIEEEKNSSADKQLCMDSSGEVKLRGEACDRLIKLGNLAGAELATAYFRRGRMRRNADQLELAIADYSEVLKLNPNHDLAYNNRGAAYLDKNDLPNALRDLNEAIRIDPKDALFLANRADVLRRQGKLSEALADANKAIDIDQKHARALSVRDAIQADVKRIEEQSRKPPAQTQSRTEPTVNPAPALRARAQAHFEKRDYASAISDYTELIQSGSRDPADYNGRGSAYHQNRQYDLAMADYARAIASSGHSWLPHYNRAAIHDMRDELDQALRDLNAAIGEHGSNDPAAFILRGSVHLQKAAYDPAWADFDKAVELAPDNPRAYLLRGRAHARRTLATIEECRSSQSTRATKDYALGGPCARPPNFTPALEDFKTAVAKKPDYAEPHFETGRIMAQEGRHEDAVRAYSAAIRADPKYSMAYNNRGAAYAELKKRELALADYDEAIRTDPRNKFGWANRASLLASMGQRQRAIADYRKALDIDQNYAYALDGLRRLGIKP